MSKCGYNEYSKLFKFVSMKCLRKESKWQEVMISPQLKFDVHFLAEPAPIQDKQKQGLQDNFILFWMFIASAELLT